MSAQDSDVALQKPSQPFWELVKVQGKLVLREPYSIVFGVAMPIFLLIIFGSVPTFREPISSDTTMTVFDLYIPILMVTVLIMIGYLACPFQSYETARLAGLGESPPHPYLQRSCWRRN